jgi:predicted N-acetyltransferase YhbS
VWGYDAAFMHACGQELTLGEDEIGELFVEEQAGAPIGFYSLQRVSDARVELGYLFVEPARMREGHGLTLLCDAISRATRLGYSTLVIQGDPHAAGFYAAAGAVQVGERPSDSIAERMLPLFELRLAPPDNVS